MLVFADFAFYGAAVVLLAAVALAALPAQSAWHAAGWVLAGLAGWTVAEYLLHRYVLHGVQPFKRWHALHHDQPRALIATPTVLTAALFAVGVGVPAWWWLAAWQASALVLGVMLGYLAYIVLHHAAHHAPGGLLLMRRHRRWHALHHRAGSQACYGVSLPLWDWALGSARPRVRSAADGAAVKP